MARITHYRPLPPKPKEPPKEDSKYLLVREYASNRLNSLGVKYLEHKIMSPKETYFIGFYLIDFDVLLIDVAVKEIAVIKKKERALFVDLTDESIYLNIETMSQNRGCFNLTNDYALIPTAEVGKRFKKYENKKAEVKKIKQISDHRMMRVIQQYKKCLKSEESQTNTNSSSRISSTIGQQQHKKIEKQSLDELIKVEKELLNYSYTQLGKKGDRAIFDEMEMEGTILLNKSLWGLTNWYLVDRKKTLPNSGVIELLYKNEKGQLNIVQYQVGEITKEMFANALLLRSDFSKDSMQDVNNIFITLLGNSIKDAVKEGCDQLGIFTYIKPLTSTRSLVDRLPDLPCSLMDIKLVGSRYY